MQNDETKEDDGTKDKTRFPGIRMQKRLDKLVSQELRVNEQWQIDLVQILRAIETNKSRYGFLASNIERWARQRTTGNPGRKVRSAFLTRLGFKTGSLVVDGKSVRIFYTGTFEIKNVSDHLIDLCAV